jgi:hypothetical protein
VVERSVEARWRQVRLLYGPLMKIEVKWINLGWFAYSKDELIARSYGIGEICDNVEEWLKPYLEPGQVVKWRAVNNKLVASIELGKQKKLSKSNMGV